MTATRMFLVLFSLLSLVLNIAGQICTPDTAGASAVYGTAAQTTYGVGTINTVTGVHIERVGANIGSLWVVGTGANSIYRYASAYAVTTTATPTFTFTSTNEAAANFNYNAPSFIATDGTACYITDTGNNRILIYSACYTATTTTPASGCIGQTASGAANAAGAAGTITAPTGIALDSSAAISATNPLFVAMKTNSEIFMFTAVVNNMYSALSGGTSIINTVISAPQGLVYVRASDNLFIADTGNNNVRIAAAASGGTGANVDIATNGAVAIGCATGFSGPKGVGYDAASNTLYVADTGNNRVIYLTAFLTTSTITGVIFPVGQAVGTCPPAGSTQNACSGPNDVDAVAVGTLAPTGSTNPTLIFSDSANQRALKLCTTSYSVSITTTAVALSLSLSTSVAGLSPSWSASIGSAGTSPSWSASLVASGAASVAISTSPSTSPGVSVTSSLSYSITISLTTSITTSLTTSITNSITNTNSNSFSITTSVTNSYTNSVTNSYTRTVSNTASYSHTISVSRSIRLCGNGKIDGKEKCDEGYLVNGTPHSCCRRNCRFKYGGHICKAPLGVQCYGKGRCDRLGKCRELKIKTGKKCNVGGNSTGIKDGRCNISAVCVVSA